MFDVMAITSLTWWRAAAVRALRTAIYVMIPFVPTVLEDGSWMILASSAGFAAMTSLLTSYVSVPAEVEGKTVPWYWAMLDRAIRTAAQALLTFVGTATMFHEVEWSLAGPVIFTAVLGSLLMGVLQVLPESEDHEELVPTKK